uniref:Uncharacterized protein n=1 Tax=Anopheles christyi TaxID=43041 RepID=A0A182JQD5_9DIPT
MISVKLFNQYHARTFDVADQLDGNGRQLDDADGALRANTEDYDTVNRLDENGNDLEKSYVQPPPIVPLDVIDLKGNGIEQDLVRLPEPLPDERLLDGWVHPDRERLHLPESTSTVGTHENRSNSLTTTTTTTTTRTTTVRKIRRKIRQQSVSSSSSRPVISSSTTTQRSTRVPSTSSQRPPRPRLDITKLNLDHLEDDLLLSYSTFIPPQAVPIVAGTVPPVRLLPRSIRQEEVAPTPSCGCQHRKRSLSNQLYSSEETVDPGTGDYDDEYDDYDYNELKLPATPSRPLFFPAMSRLLASASSGEQPEGSSVERAQKVHGTLERLMGIVTIFSHVDEFIQRKTKQSIRRLARLYESEELD